MKIIKINDSQRKRLFERQDEGFSFETLSMIGDGQFGGEDKTEAQYYYCVKYLGEPIGEGSSRYVFQLNDNLVLKLSDGYDGFKQNENEAEAFKAIDSELLVKILYFDKSGSYLVSEKVLPANRVDFEKYLGIPFYDTYQQDSKPSKSFFSKHNGDREVGYNKYFDNIIPKNTYSDIDVYSILCYMERSKHEYNPKYERIIRDSWWFTEIRRLINDYGICDLSLNNFGLVNRDGQPKIVILDYGLKMSSSEEF